MRLVVASSRNLDTGLGERSLIDLSHNNLSVAEFDDAGRDVWTKGGDAMKVGAEISRWI